MSRAAVYTLVSTDATVQSLGIPVGAVYASNAQDTPQDESEMFVILRWEEKTVTFGDNVLGTHKGTQFLSVWVHSRGRAYDPINAVLARIKTILTSAVHVLGADGVTLTQADYTGESGDLYDDGFHTLTRYHSYRIACR